MTTSAMELLFSCALITHNIQCVPGLTAGWFRQCEQSFLPKEKTVAESPNWASNLEPCDYQADDLAVIN